MQSEEKQIVKEYLQYYHFYKHQKQKMNNNFQGDICIYVVKLIFKEGGGDREKRRENNNMFTILCFEFFSDIKCNIFFKIKPKKEKLKKM